MIRITALRRSMKTKCPLASPTAPLLVAVLTVVIGIRLLARDTGPGSWFMAQAVFAMQVPAFSAGPITYRLVVGPFLTITLAGQTLGFGLHGGVDAHLLLITGGASHLPFGIAVDLVALAGLTPACMGFIETISVNEAVERTTV